ncbi:hypothetical protein ACFZCF_29825 [Streptomyces sp. NPDC007945]|uniref:hypothetical protein n=1 Tax=Streptomyces sp. NPDC007945 TaxID=3364797 RepID=UPI0036E31746
MPGRRLAKQTAAPSLGHKAVGYGMPGLAWWQHRHHGTRAEVRCVGERTVATSNGRRLVRRFRCGTTRVTAIVRAFLVLHHASA